MSRNVKMKPVEVLFEFQDKNFKLSLHRWHYKIYEEVPLTVWEGGLMAVEMGVKPAKYVEIAPSKVLCITALGVIKGLPKEMKTKIAKRAVDRVVMSIDPGYTWQQKYNILNDLGVL